MTKVNHSVYASAPFKFVVGGNPYYVHADLVSQHSRPLDRIINGQKAEAQKGYAVLEEVDEGTFERFVKWAYTGYYTAADFKVESTVPSALASSSQKQGRFNGRPETAQTEAAFTVERFAIAEEEPAPATEGLVATPADDWEGWGISQRDLQRQATTRQSIKKSFVQRPYTIRQEMIAIPRTRANREAQENYSEVFLSHARLYVFAEKYDIQVLKTLALEELHHTLAIYTLYPQRTGDIVALLRYVYAEIDVTVKSNEDLRSLLREYIGFEMKVLLGDKDFTGLLVENGGLLLGDILEIVVTLID